MGHYYEERHYDLGRPVVLRYKMSEFPYMPDYPSVREGHRLVGKLSNGLRCIFPDLTERAEFEEFYNNYANGYWLSFDVREVNELSLQSK